MFSDELRTFQLLDAIRRECRVGESIYRAAAATAPDSDLKYLFSSYAAQRTRFDEELRSVLETLGWVEGAEVPVEREVSGPGAGEGRSPRQLLETCARVEEETISRYKRVLAEELPDACRAVMERQVEELRAVRERLRDLHALAG